MTDTTKIDPASVAGILLREFDTPEKAIEYAGVTAKRFLAAHNAIGLDYLEAIEQIKSTPTFDSVVPKRRDGK